MRAMTCRQLGGPCDARLEGATADEVIKAQDQHLKDAVAAARTHECRVSAAAVHARGSVDIAISRCKGCELCIPACPPRVQRMSEARNELGVPYPELLPGCTGCGACLLVCPDFCFEVHRYEASP